MASALMLPELHELKSVGTNGVDRESRRLAVRSLERGPFDASRNFDWDPPRVRGEMGRGTSTGAARGGTTRIQLLHIRPVHALGPKVALSDVDSALHFS